MRRETHILAGLPLLILLPAWAAADSGARVYRNVDASGLVRYTNIPHPNIPHPSFSSRGKPSEPPSGLRDMIRSTASRHGISPQLVEAIVAVESSFNPLAVSRKGAMGLMQLMPETANAYAVRNPFDPLENIQGGIRLLRDLLHQFQGDLPLVLAAYNAGGKAVVEYNGIPPYRETQEYVKKVLGRYGGSPVMYPRTVSASYRLYRVISPGGTPHYSNLPLPAPLR